MPENGHVFISYSRNDGNPHAEKLENALKNQGFGIWRDTRNLQPTQDFTQAPAMAEEDCVHAMAYGMMAVEEGYDVYALGEMGIGNTTSAAALCHALFGGAPEDWTGRGTGVDDAGLARKAAVVAEGVAAQRAALDDPLEVLRRLGGFELAAVAGAILAARLAGTPVLLECLWLDPERFPGLGRSSLAGRSLSQLAREHYRLEAESADQDFRVAAPGEERGRLLELSPDAPVLLVKRRIHFPNARDAVFSELFCRTDRLVFSQTLGGPRD